MKNWSWIAPAISTGIVCTYMVFPQSFPVWDLKKDQYEGVLKNSLFYEVHGGIYGNQTYYPSGRVPAAESKIIYDDSWGASPLDYPHSAPKVGRSYFDIVFSKEENGKRVYDIPYPFQKLIAKLQTNLKPNEKNQLNLVAIPLGRSLQRDAAVVGTEKKSLAPYFRFPRLVVGVTGEPNQSEDALNINLKDRIFIGFHEKAQVLEAISYNDEEGRFEYQVIKDYGPGKKERHGEYVNRKRCLPCHQNQSPIFSKGPWKETSANEEMSKYMEETLLQDKSLGPDQCKKDSEIEENKDGQKFCFKNEDGQKKYYYFGVPLRVSGAVTDSYERAAEKANYFSMYQKIWQKLCAEKNCRYQTIKYVLQYMLSGQQGIVKSSGVIENFLTPVAAKFSQMWPSGLKVPDPKIPNRDPIRDRRSPGIGGGNSSTGNLDQDLQKLVSDSMIPGELEPTLPRRHLTEETWNNLAPDDFNVNQWLVGLTNMFTREDIAKLDANLFGLGQSKSKRKEFKTICDWSGFNGNSFKDQDYQIVCGKDTKSDQKAELRLFFRLQNGKVVGGSDAKVGIFSSAFKCDENESDSVENQVKGVACPQLSFLKISGEVVSGKLKIYLWEKSGIHARFFDGNSIGAIDLTPAMKDVTVSIQGDFEFLDGAIQKTVEANVKNLPFDRRKIMSGIYSNLGFSVGKSNYQNLPQIYSLQIHEESDTKPLVGDEKSALGTVTRHCGYCHYTAEVSSAPPFLGIKPVELSAKDRCQRVAKCAPRMAYRIKMNNCSEEDRSRKKMQMPPAGYFDIEFATERETFYAKGGPNDKILGFVLSLINEKELQKQLVAKGLAAPESQRVVNELLKSNCPNVEFKYYEMFPKCEYNQGNAAGATTPVHPTCAGM